MSALIGSCSETIQPLLSPVTTAHRAWEKLALAYASTSRGRVISLKTTMTKTIKGNRSILEYLVELMAYRSKLGEVWERKTLSDEHVCSTWFEEMPKAKHTENC
ncbi:unnamed protein product [Cuscuta epithymum]|uniref:Uncharacterized protein n=1 Tax=Cuscuta epithymum TaxID=186058 RepID=A0AAV0FEV4_9ASTE|nr:unnamed protein product [Cuscuta epithymum]